MASGGSDRSRAHAGARERECSRASHIPAYRVGGLRVEKLNEIIEKVIDIIRS